ncbi:MAG: hypothetical protein LBF26_02525 [Puniceicoccales bacterium]|nr:hypothetical protein [Puniceicoccales bacterium]
MNVTSTIFARSRELVKIEDNSIEVRYSNPGVVWLRKCDSDQTDGPYDVTTVMIRLPELLEEKNVFAYASVMLYLIYGWYRLPFVNLTEIEEIRNDSEHCTYDVSSLALPRVEGNRITFFARGFLVGPAIYKIVGPYPYRKGDPGHFTATILPRRRAPEIEQMKNMIGIKCILL